jgi:magnesium transporter
MITLWAPGEKGLVRQDGDVCSLCPKAAWIDICDITPEEEQSVESALGIDLPTRAEMQEIEASSRLYREGSTVYMTVTMLIKTETGAPESTAVTFILMKDRLITLRYAEPWSIRTFSARAPKSGCLNAQQVCIAIFETTIERLADMLEIVAHEMEHISQQVFRKQVSDNSEMNLQKMLMNIGRSGNLLSKARESLVDKHRALTFVVGTDWIAPDVQARMHGVLRDVQQLNDHATFTANKMQFLLDASLGFINIEQNRIFKYFSILAVAFAPMNVLAGMGGMSEFTAGIVNGWGIPGWLAYSLFAVIMVGTGWSTWWLLVRFGPGGAGFRRKRRHD